MAIKQGVFNTGDTVSAIHMNTVTDEVNNAISNANIVLSDIDQVQLSKALAVYGSGSSSYTENSVVQNVYNLVPIDGKLAPPAYFDGMEVGFFPNLTNIAGPVTINVAGIGVKNVNRVTIIGTQNLRLGDIRNGTFCKLVFKAADNEFKLILSYGMFTGSAKAWCIGDGRLPGIQVEEAFNVSSMTREANGRYRFDFNTSLLVPYVVCGSTEQIIDSTTNDDYLSVVERNTNFVTLNAVGDQGVIEDVDRISFAILGFK